MAAPEPARGVGEREVAELRHDVAIDVARDPADVYDVVLTVGADGERRELRERLGRLGDGLLHVQRAMEPDGGRVDGERGHSVPCLLGSHGRAMPWGSLWKPSSGSSASISVAPSSPVAPLPSTPAAAP